MAYGIIYRAIRVSDGKAYYGQTVMGLAARRYQHEFSAKCDRGKNRSYFLNALRTSEFIWEQVEECHSQGDLDSREKFWINEANSRHPNGFNLQEGGRGGPHSEETKTKIRAKRARQVIKHSQETRKRMSESQKVAWEKRSRTISSEVIERRAKGIKEAWKFRSRTMSDEQKAKISSSVKRAWERKRNGTIGGQGSA